MIGLKKILISSVITVLIIALLSQNASATTSTSTALTSSLNPSTSGAPVTFTATVSPAVPDAETVTFYDGITAIGTGVTSGSVATFTTSSLSVGLHQINATYLGDSNFNSSSSPVLAQTVDKGSTTTTITTNTNPSVYGQAVTFRATVAPVAPSTGTPTASVIFTIDGIAQPPVANYGGSATFTTSALSAGTHQVTAQFVGSSNFASSTSSVFVQTVNRYGGYATSCSGLAYCHYVLSSAAGSGYSQTYAGVGGYVGQSPLYFSGTAAFLLPGEAVATYNGTISGAAILAGYSSTAGTVYHVKGNLTGRDANDGFLVKGSTDTFVGIKGHSGRGGGNTYTLINGSIAFTKSGQRSSSTTVACTPSSITLGGVTTCKVTVTDPGAGFASTPTGVVSFTASNTFLGSLSPTSCTLSSGSCSVNFKSNAESEPGTTSIYASYPGDSIHVSSSGSTLVYVASNENTLSVSINAPSSGTVGALVNLNSAVTGGASPYTYSWTMTVPAGSKSTLSSATVSNPTFTPDVPGSYQLGLAVTDSASNTAVATQATVTITSATQTTITSSLNPSTYGQSVTFTATVSPGTATGTVTFTIDGTAQPAVTLSSGTASYSTSLLSAGTHQIVAAYSGDANYASSTSSALTQTVNQGTTNTIITLNPVSSVAWGKTITVSGKLTNSSSGAGLGGKTITFSGTGGVNLPNAVTDSNGFYTSTGAAPSTVTNGLTVQAHFAGDSQYQNTDSATITYNTLIHSTVFWSLNVPSSVTHGSKYAVDGKLKDSTTGLFIPSKTVTFTSTSPIIIPSAVTDSTGTFSASNLTAPAAGSYNIQAHFAGDSLYTPSDSVTKVLKVT